MKKEGIDKFSKRLDEIFDQGMPTKVQIIDAYNKFSQQQPSIDKISATAFVESCADMTEYVAGKKIAHRFRKYTIPVIEYNELRKAAKDFDNKQPELSEEEKKLTDKEKEELFNLEQQLDIPSKLKYYNKEDYDKRGSEAVEQPQPEQPDNSLREFEKILNDYMTDEEIKEISDALKAFKTVRDARRTEANR